MRSVECNTRNDAKSQSLCLLELGSAEEFSLLSEKIHGNTRAEAEIAVHLKVVDDFYFPDI